MTALQWDLVGDRTYETGVDRGVLYLPDGSGNYDTGVAWNGLTTVTEKPTGAAATPQWADNIKYLNLIAAEEFGATIAAFTYPEEFAECDGTAVPSPGLIVGQQHRKAFGLSYRTLLGNDVEGNDYGYKLHLIYGCQAAPAEKAYATVNDSPAAIDFSWDVTTTPVAVAALKPTSLIVVDSSKVDATALASLQDLLWGSGAGDARLPLPDEVIALFSGTVVEVDLGVYANQPTYNATTHVVTLPAVAGVQWRVNGNDAAPGAQPALAVGETADVDAVPTPGHSLQGDTDWSFDY
jgi:hypothetical protein